MPIQRRVFLICAVIVVVGLLAALGYRYWYQPTYDFFNTDDAHVTGSLVEVAAPASGQIDATYVDAGSPVNKNDPLATIKVVAPVSNAAAPGAAVTGPSIPRVLVRVNSPVTGTVAVKDVSVGNTIAAGQSVATVVDLSQLWVIVNVDESRIADVRVGAPADVEIDDVGQTFRGQVSDLGSATTDVTSPSASLLSTSGSSSDTTLKVPVKITFGYAGYRLVPGMTANVTIYTKGTQ